MKIRRMRFVLPARMRGTAQVDARLLATAAARALQTGQISGGPVEVQGGGRPASLIAREIGRIAHIQSSLPKRKV